MKSIAVGFVLYGLLFILGCSDADITSAPKNERDLPTVAFGAPDWYPSDKLPKNVVSVYLDGPLIECEGHFIKNDDVTSFVTKQLMEKGTQVVFVFTTSEVHFGQVADVVDKIRKAPVKWVRLDDRMIASGHRFRQ